MTTFTRRAVTASSVALLAGCASGGGGSTVGESPAAPAGRAAIGAFGIDLASRDLNVKPGDDFLQHMNGGWFRDNTIPDDRTTWGTTRSCRKRPTRPTPFIEEPPLAGGPRDRKPKNR